MSKSLPIQDFAWVELSEALPEFGETVLLCNECELFLTGCLEKVEMSKAKRELYWHVPGWVGDDFEAIYWASIPPVNTPQPHTQEG